MIAKHDTHRTAVATAGPAGCPVGCIFMKQFEGKRGCLSAGKPWTLYSTDENCSQVQVVSREAGLEAPQLSAIIAFIARGVGMYPTLRGASFVIHPS